MKAIGLVLPLVALLAACDDSPSPRCPRCAATAARASQPSPRAGRRETGQHQRRLAPRR